MGKLLVMYEQPGFAFDPPQLLIDGDDNSSGSYFLLFQGRPILYWTTGARGREYVQTITSGDLLVLEEAGVPTYIRATSDFNTNFGGYFYYDADWETDGDQRVPLVGSRNLTRVEIQVAP